MAISKKSEFSTDKTIQIPDHFGANPTLNTKNNSNSLRSPQGLWLVWLVVEPYPFEKNEFVNLDDDSLS